MADITIVIMENKFPAIRAGMETLANQAVRSTIADIEGRAKTSMTGPKTGLLYHRPGGKAHQASAPGEPPAVDTGNLMNSLQSEMTGATSGVVYTVAEYAPALEMGSVRMEARPFLTPATTGAWPNFLTLMSKAAG